MQHAFSRRYFLAACSTAIAALLVRSETVWAGGRFVMDPGPHPTPRPGITGDAVLTREQLAGKPKLILLFDSVREMPEIIDGIRCNCGCSHPPEYYSLLSCFEGKAMALDCGVCQGQGRLAARLRKDGKTLDEIRAAIDAKFK